MTFEGVQVATIMFAGKRGEPAFVLEVPGEFVDPGCFALEHKDKSIAFQGFRDQFTEPRQEIDAHSWMKTVCIRTANRKKADA